MRFVLRFQTSGRTLRQNQRPAAVSLRAVDQDDDVIDILQQSRRDQRAAERFLRRLLRGQGKQPFRIITRKLKSYAAGQSNDPPIQITPTSSTLSIAPRSRPESVLRFATLAEIDSSTTLEISVLRSLAKGNGGMTISNLPSPITQTRSEWLKFDHTFVEVSELSRFSRVLS